MPDHDSFKHYVAGLDEMECLIVKGKLLREHEQARRLNNQSWQRLANEMLGIVDKRLEYLSRFNFNDITKLAKELDQNNNNKGE